MEKTFQFDMQIIFIEQLTCPNILQRRKEKISKVSIEISIKLVK